MTDNEIIADLKEILALVCCDGDLQRAATIHKAIDLINRQKAEIERLNELLETRHKVFETKCEEIESLRELVSRLERDIGGLNKIIDTSEYPFKVKVGHNSEVHSKSIEDYDSFLNGVSAEAVKEFAERLESLKKFRTRINSSEYELSVTMRDIDNLLKEMVGEGL